MINLYNFALVIWVVSIITLLKFLLKKNGTHYLTVSVSKKHLKLVIMHSFSFCNHQRQCLMVYKPVICIIYFLHQFFKSFHYVLNIVCYTNKKSHISTLNIKKQDHVNVDSSCSHLLLRGRAGCNYVREDKCVKLENDAKLYLIREFMFV